MINTICIACHVWFALLYCDFSITYALRVVNRFFEIFLIFLKYFLFCFWCGIFALYAVLLCFNMFILENIKKPLKTKFAVLYAVLVVFVLACVYLVMVFWLRFCVVNVYACYLYIYVMCMICGFGLVALYEKNENFCVF